MEIREDQRGGFRGHSNGVKNQLFFFLDPKKIIKRGSEVVTVWELMITKLSKFNGIRKSLLGSVSTFWLLFLLTQKFFTGSGGWCMTVWPSLHHPTI